MRVKGQLTNRDFSEKCLECCVSFCRDVRGPRNNRVQVVGDCVLTDSLLTIVIAVESQQ